MCVFCVISGGYNIKTGPGCSIEIMKVDMGGSAAVLGAAKAIGQIKPPGVEVSVHFFIDKRKGLCPNSCCLPLFLILNILCPYFSSLLMVCRLVTN